MKNIFTFIEDVLYNKPKYKIEPDDEFSSFMLQRWISMANPTYCNFINAIYNINHLGFEDDQMVYDYLKCVFPKKYMRISYIKKEASATASKNKTIIEDVAKSLQISQREVKEYFELFPKDVKELKDNDAKVMKKVDKEDEID
jgi:hypothetical protein